MSQSGMRGMNSTGTSAPPKKPGRLTARKNAAQVYAFAVLEAADADRIKRIGKKHLQLAAEKALDGSQLSSFLTNVIAYER